MARQPRKRVCALPTIARPDVLPHFDQALDDPLWLPSAAEVVNCGFDRGLDACDRLADGARDDLHLLARAEQLGAGQLVDPAFVTGRAFKGALWLTIPSTHRTPSHRRRVCPGLRIVQGLGHVGPWWYAGSPQASSKPASIPAPARQGRYAEVRCCPQKPRSRTRTRSGHDGAQGQSLLAPWRPHQRPATATWRWMRETTSSHSICA